MAPNQDRALIPIPPHELTATKIGGNRILSEMVGASLALIRQAPLFKIGEYEWHETDYRQILIWAKAMTLDPEEVILRLLDRRSLIELGFGEYWPPTLFGDGRIVKLNWDLDLLPLDVFEWTDGLEIQYLRLAQHEKGHNAPSVESLSPRLPNLLHLVVTHCYNLRELRLTYAPKVEKFD